MLLPPMPATLKDLLRIHSREADACLDYLRAVIAVLSEQPLLKRFERSLNEKGLRIPLHAEPFDAARLRDREAQEQRERDGISMQAGDPDAEKRLYSHRSASGDDKKEEKAKPEPLAALLETLEVAMLIGDPGGGKSEALKGLAVRTAQCVFDHLDAHLALVEDVRLPVFAELPVVARLFGDDDQRSPLADFARDWLCFDAASIGDDAIRLRIAILKAAVNHIALDNENGRGLCAPALRKIWREWQEPHAPGAAWHGGAILLLDAWDEIPDRHRTDGFIRALRTLSGKPPARLLATSRIVGFASGVLDCPASSAPGAPRRELVILPFRDEDKIAFLHAFFPSRDTAERLIADLRTKPMVMAMLQNPLLASLVAFAFEPSISDGKPIPLPTKRAAVYDAVVHRLLGDDEARRKGKAALPPEAVRDLIEILQRLAFHFFPDERFDEDSVIDWCRENPPPAGSKLALHLANAGRTLTDCLLASGLLTRHGEHELKFLHLTFEEYFAGGRIATTICTDGWAEAQVSVRGRRKPVPVSVLIDKKAWHPRWREVIALTAGQLDPKNAPVEPLLEMLTACKDDIFQHRLCLAMLCMVEARGFDRSAGSIAARVGQKAWDLFGQKAWGLFELRDDSIVADRRLGQYLGVANPPLDGHLSVLKMLAAILGDSNASDGLRSSAAGAVGGIGVAAGTPEILAGLAAMLGDRNAPDGLRSTAADAVAGIGAAAGTPDILAGLLAILGDPDESDALRGHAEYAVGGMGAAAGTPEFLAGLAAILGDINVPDRMRSSAAHAVRGIGAAAGTPEFLAALATILGDRNVSVEVRLRAAEAVGCIGAAACAPEILVALAAMLGTDEMRMTAAETVRRIGAAAGTPEILAELVAILGDRNASYGERVSAESAVCSIGAVGTGTPEYLTALAAILGTPSASDAQRRRYADAAGIPGILDGWAARLGDISASDDMRIRAALTVGRFGAAAGTPDILAALEAILGDRNVSVEVRLRAAEAVHSVGAAAATAEFLAALAAILGTPNASDDMRCGTAYAVHGIGAAAGTPEILAGLAAMLGDFNVPDRMRWHAANAVGGIGAAAGTPEFLDQLMNCPMTKELRDVLRLFFYWRWFERGAVALVRISVEELSKLPPGDR